MVIWELLLRNVNGYENLRAYKVRCLYNTFVEGRIGLDDISKQANIKFSSPDKVLDYLITEESRELLNFTQDILTEVNDLKEAIKDEESSKKSLEKKLNRSKEINQELREKSTSLEKAIKTTEAERVRLRDELKKAEIFVDHVKGENKFFKTMCKNLSKSLKNVSKSLK